MEIWKKGDLAEAKGPSYENLLSYKMWHSLDDRFEKLQSTVEGTNRLIKVYFAEKGAYDAVVDHYKNKFTNLKFAFMPPLTNVPQSRTKGWTRDK